jgi:hypothetical protein
MIAKLLLPDFDTRRKKKLDDIGILKMKNGKKDR